MLAGAAWPTLEVRSGSAGACSRAPGGAAQLIHSYGPAGETGNSTLAASAAWPTLEVRSGSAALCAAGLDLGGLFQLFVQQTAWQRYTSSLNGPPPQQRYTNSGSQLV